MAEVRLIEIKENILEDNVNRADEIRARLAEKNVFMLNLMGSPGSGKTSLVLATLRGLRQDTRCAVIEADIDSMVDAEKVALENVPAIQLRTGGACHVDAAMVEMGLRELDLDVLDLVTIENVGNLVCPAEFDTGANKRVAILSVPEGDDKPLKYPLMFSVCDAIVISKIDCLPYFDFNIEKMKERVLKLNQSVRFFEVSCKTGEGVQGWLDWLRAEIGVSDRRLAA